MSFVVDEGFGLCCNPVHAGINRIIESASDEHP